jgi:hypothetical protein
MFYALAKDTKLADKLSIFIALGAVTSPEHA